MIRIKIISKNQMSKKKKFNKNRREKGDVNL